MTIADQNSDVVQTSYAIETSLGVLPGGAGAVWYIREPNTFPKFGGEPSIVQRAPVGTRRKLPGTVTGISVKGGWNEDQTPNNYDWLIQAALLNPVLEKPDTVPLNGAATPITSITLTNQINAAAGLGAFINRDLILLSGFTNAGNNGIQRLSAVAANALTVAGTPLTNEAAPPAAARVKTIGHQFASGDAVMTWAGGVLSLTTTTQNLTNLNASVGEWWFIGGDAAGQNFATITPGFARIATIAAHAITFDKTTFTPSADAGAGQTVVVYYGSVFKDSANPTIYSCSVEQLLGSDGAGIQSRYLDASMVNELTVNIPKKDKLHIDLAFLSLNDIQNTGTVGPRLGTHVAALNEPAINTSSDIYRFRMAPVGGGLNPAAYWGYATTATLKINNNLTANEAVGSVGGFDINVGELDISGTTEAYFTTVPVMQAVRAKTVVTLDFMFTQYNTGMIIDIPAIELGDGLPKIEKNKPIMLSLNTTAILNNGATGYCIMFNKFKYLPNVAMAAGEVSGGGGVTQGTYLGLG